MDRYADGVTQERLGLPELWRGVMDMQVRRPPHPCSMPTGSQPPRLLLPHSWPADALTVAALLSYPVHLPLLWWWQANTERLRQSIATKAEVAASKSVVEIYARYDNIRGI